MADALWVQTTGVDYSAAEDRRLISSVFSSGVIYGLGISAGSGLAASVAAGRAVVPDGAGGAYLCYFDTPTVLSGLPANATNNVFVTVSTSGQGVIVRGATPSTPYLQLGSAVTNASVVTAVNNTALTAEVPTVTGRYLRSTGGYVGGTLQAERFLVENVFDANGTSVYAPKGIRMGATTNRTARHYAGVNHPDNQVIPTGVWTALRFTGIQRNTTDYSLAPFNPVFPNAFIAGVAGDYQISGHAVFNSSTPGERLARVVRRNAGTNAVSLYRYGFTTSGNIMNFNAMMNAGASDFFELQVLQTSGSDISINADTASSASFRLIQAD